jgi:hypothetical protein
LRDTEKADNSDCQEKEEGYPELHLENDGEGQLIQMIDKVDFSTLDDYNHKRHKPPTNNHSTDPFLS